MAIKKFTDLDAWKEEHKLTILVYKYTEMFPKSETFGLTSQIRRAVVSIESCIAEGFSRYHYKDRLNFYFDSRGSLAEVQTQSIVAKDLGYLSEDRFTEIAAQSDKVGIILGGLVRSTGKLSHS
ncbi:MAG: 23S ribosomal protein [Candidatus Woesebacteria bacterium GW2011_GWA1_38_8]|uniref:23S ribosomal protein n=1 Tax=Candidatus Woesebacteria bacterium GW2011_GWA1_38_8 TaxID=1618547 RepID=A0A0G0L4D5_9BACT|nr:MAG: 23S ribosomal protein [Microgenomates group bacterium GW2011_GWF1_38_5]KKQ82725.1 MAG: 23S ribosomal protein [Candidatus Woesebacteria bacterium GW2011_GWA1_38_8]